MAFNKLSEEQNIGLKLELAALAPACQLQLFFRKASEANTPQVLRVAGSLESLQYGRRAF